MATAHGLITASWSSPRLGALRCDWSRPLEGTPKTVTISRQADGWYVAISCANAPVHPLPPMGQETEIDLGLESIATPANGQPICIPRYYRKAPAYLRRCQRRDQRRVTRRKRRSDPRGKAVNLLAKARQMVNGQLRDFHHKEARTLVQHYDTIYHEELRVANMIGNHHRAESIANA